MTLGAHDREIITSDYFDRCNIARTFILHTNISSVSFRFISNLSQQSHVIFLVALYSGRMRCRDSQKVILESINEMLVLFS